MAGHRPGAELPGGLVTHSAWQSFAIRAPDFDVDTRSDVYSLGMILYELLAGALPFDAEALRAHGDAGMRRVISECEPPKPSARLTTLPLSAQDAVAKQRSTTVRRLAPSLRGELDWITLRALEKDRASRYATANAMALDIRRFLQNEPVAAGPPRASYRIGKFVRRHRVAVGVSAAVLAALVTLVGALAIQSSRLSRERDRATQQAATATRVTELLTSLFKVSDPSEARGRAVTVREVLSEASKRVKEDVGNEPDVQAELQSTIGNVYAGLGLYGDAEPLLRFAFDTFTRRKGIADPATIKAGIDLGSLYWKQGRIGTAEEIFETAARDSETAFGPSDPRTLQAKMALATVLAEHRERWPDAEPQAAIAEGWSDQRRRRLNLQRH